MLNNVHFLKKEILEIYHLEVVDISRKSGRNYVLELCLLIMFWRNTRNAENIHVKMQLMRNFRKNLDFSNCHFQAVELKRDICHEIFKKWRRRLILLLSVPIYMTHIAAKSKNFYV